MKRIILALSLALMASMASAQYVDDMYDTTPAKPKKQNSAKADKSYIYKPAQQEQAVETATTSDNKELITSFEEALQRRLNALRNPYEMDDAYWLLMQQYQAILEAKYDKHLYNIVVVGNDMWVEPQSVTAMFDGSDPAEGVIKYNEQIKKRLTGEQPQKSKATSESSGSAGGGQIYESGNQTVNIYLTVDPWSYSSWNYGWGRPYYGYGWGGGWGWGWGGGWGYPYYGYGGGWGYPYYGYGGGWGYPYYGYGGGWGGGYYNSPTHNHNPRGTYYGNSASGYSRNQSGGGLGGARQPRVNGNIAGRNTGTGRGEVANLRPTGVNTVSGITGRGGRGELRGRGNIPTGGVADMRNSGVSLDGGATTRGRTNREGTVTRPNTQNYNPSSTFERPTRNTNSTTTYERRDRNTYEQPVERPTTYDRPTQRPTTYERPSSFDRGGGSTISRPSGGGGSGGSSGGGGGGMGGSRPTGGRGR